MPESTIGRSRADRPDRRGPARADRSMTERPRMRNRLPLALRLYRVASVAAPLAPRLLAWRLKRGKENPARLTERYGVTGAPRPAGPLVWVHGSSVGEMLAVIPLIERLRAMNFA